MVSRDIHHTTNLANAIGKPKGVQCKYEWDRVKRVFVWRFYRRNIAIGSTATPGEVVKRMTKFITTSEGTQS